MKKKSKSASTEEVEESLTVQRQSIDSVPQTTSSSTAPTHDTRSRSKRAHTLSIMEKPRKPKRKDDCHSEEQMFDVLNFQHLLAKCHPKTYDSVHLIVSPPFNDVVTKLTLKEKMKLAFGHWEDGEKSFWGLFEVGCGQD